MRARNVIFDFDGPVCSVFAGLPAPTVAKQLRRIARRNGASTAEIDGEDDPLGVLRWAGRQSPRILAQIEDALIRAETVAATYAQPTPGAHDLIRALRTQQRFVGIASNNSSSAISRYLSLHGLTASIAAISGRTPYAPHTMKPNDHCLRDCMIQLSTSPNDCIFIGDSVTDVEAAKSAGIPVVGFANKEGKAELLGAAGADLVVSDLAVLG